MKISIVKKEGRLVVVDEMDEESMFKLKEGVIYSFNCEPLRNPLFHRKFFKMLNLCFTNQETFNNFDNFRNTILIVSGYFDECKSESGNVICKAKSVSFDNMKQDEFEAMYEAVFMSCIRIFKWQEVKEEFINELNEYR